MGIDWRRKGLPASSFLAQIRCLTHNAIFSTGIVVIVVFREGIDAGN